MSETLQAAVLAPGGLLRVAVNTGNPVLVQADASGALAGVVPVLAAELARRLGCPLELLPYKRPGEVAAAATADAWDVCFLADEPARAAVIEFTRPHVLIEGVYLVPEVSALTRPADVDAPGIRVGVSGGSAYDLFLGRTLQSATLVRAESADASAALLTTGAVDVVAGVRQPLEHLARRMGGTRVMAERFMTIPQAGGVPRDRIGACRMLDSFIADALRSGLVARALRDSGQDSRLAAPVA